MMGFMLGTRVGQMAAQITFTGTVVDNDDAEFPFVAVVAADNGQLLARYPVRIGPLVTRAHRSVRDAQDASRDAYGCGPLRGIERTIAWLDAMPRTEAAVAIAAQRDRAVAEQMEIAKRRLKTLRAHIVGISASACCAASPFRFFRVHEHRWVRTTAHIPDFSSQEDTRFPCG